MICRGRFIYVSTSEGNVYAISNFIEKKRSYIETLRSAFRVSMAIILLAVLSIVILNILGARRRR